MKKAVIGGIVAILVFSALVIGMYCSGNLLQTLPNPLSSTTPLKFQGSLSASGSETVPTGDDYIAIAGAGIYRLALRVNGSIVSWGDDRYERIPSGNDFIAIAAGSENGVALRSNGSIVCWGRVTTGNRSTSCNPPAGNDFIAISSGDQQNLALHSNGSIVQWGNNQHGEGEVPPGTDYVAIAAGQFCNLALRSNGTIVCWGGEDCCDLSPEDEYVAISADKWTQHLALTSKGELVAWDNVMGWNRYVPPGTDFIAISVGNGRSAALRADGTVICWPDYETCNTSAFTDSIAISAVPYNVLAITNPRAKEILAAEWQKTKAHIRTRPGNEKNVTAWENRAPVYPVTYVIEAALPEVQDPVMTYCGKDPITGFFPHDLVEDARNVPSTSPYREFAIKSPDEAIGEFKTHRLTITEHYLYEHGPIESADAIVVTNISFGYTPNTRAGNNCLQPVYAFEGYVEKDGGHSFFSTDFVPATENLVAFDYMMTGPVPEMGGTSENQTTTLPAMTVVVTPHFYGTISFGSNRSSALTEDQAWKYADAFFKSAGVRNVRSSDVIALGQKIWKYSNGSQEMVWSFQVKFDRNWTSLGSGYGGVIDISAYDGHVVDYAGVQ